MKECEICEFATSVLFNIHRGNYRREVCWECYLAWLEVEADNVEMEEN